MPGVDPPWSQPQDTQYCPECERLWRVNDALKAQVKEAKEAIKAQIDTCENLLSGPIAEIGLRQALKILNSKVPS